MVETRKIVVDGGIDTASLRRMLNAIEPGAPLPIHIHRHQTTSETVVCLRGRLVEEFYDERERICTDLILVLMRIHSH